MSQKVFEKYKKAKIFAGKKASRGTRRIVGILLILGGLFGFLPILGFWMIPLGLALLSSESVPNAKLWRRKRGEKNIDGSSSSN